MWVRILPRVPLKSTNLALFPLRCKDVLPMSGKIHFTEEDYKRGLDPKDSRIAAALGDQGQKEKMLEEQLEMSIAEIGLVVRTSNVLEAHGIFTVGALLEREPEDLLSIPNFGDKTLEEIYQALEGIGFSRSRRAV